MTRDNLAVSKSAAEDGVDVEDEFDCAESGRFGVNRGRRPVLVREPDGVLGTELLRLVDMLNDYLRS